MSNYTGNGGYSLNKLVLKTRENSEGYDLSLGFIDITLFESIWNHTMSGSVSVIDTFNMKDVLNLSGGETVEIDFNTNGTNTHIKFTGTVYKISTSQKITEHASGYVIHFTSEAAILNARSKIQRGFGDTATNTVKKIYDTFLKTGAAKPYIEKPSKGIDTYTFGCVTPFEGIAIALRNAMSNENDCGYVFYEDNQAFNCTPLESLYQQPARLTYVNKPMNIFEDVSQKDVENFNAIQDIEFLQEESFLDRIMDGEVGSSFLFFDIQSKNFEKVQYDLTSWFDEKRSIGTVPLKNLEETNPNYSDKIYMDIHGGSPELNRYLVESKFRKQEIHNNRIRIMVYGDSNVRCGVCCDVKLPKYQSNHENADTLSGKFLITEVKHTLSNQKYYQTLMIQKNAYERMK